MSPSKLAGTEMSRGFEMKQPQKVGQKTIATKTTPTQTQSPPLVHAQQQQEEEHNYDADCGQRRPIVSQRRRRSDALMVTARWRPLARRIDVASDQMDALCR